MNWNWTRHFWIERRWFYFVKYLLRFWSEYKYRLSFWLHQIYLENLFTHSFSNHKIWKNPIKFEMEGNIVVRDLLKKVWNNLRIGIFYNLQNFQFYLHAIFLIDQNAVLKKVILIQDSARKILNKLFSSYFITFELLAIRAKNLTLHSTRFSINISSQKEKLKKKWSKDYNLVYCPYAAKNF